MSLCFSDRAHICIYFWNVKYQRTIPIITRRFCKNRSAVFALLRKSLRMKEFEEIRLIFVFFDEFESFFEKSKKKKVQASWSLIFHGIIMKKTLDDVFKIAK